MELFLENQVRRTFQLEEVNVIDGTIQDGLVSVSTVQHGVSDRA